MFISTPIVRFVTGKLHQRGLLDAMQRDALLRHDLHMNIVLTLFVGVSVAVFLAQQG